MDEARIQAYLELIQALLACPGGQEGALLEARRELVDAGLVSVMGQVAEMLRREGQPNADWLENMAGQVAQALGLPSPPAPLPGGEGSFVDRSAYGLKRHAIEASIYGVDVDAGAVDIARLRLWLSLVVDEVGYEQIQPLPNLDYKIAVGNSLLGLEELGERLENPLFRHNLLEQLEVKQQKYLRATDPGRKAALKTEMGEFFRSAMGTELGFDFRLYFSEVFRSSNSQGGGFDVVIGNPPCASYKHIGDLKPALQAQYDCYTGTADLYIFFYEQGLKLLRPGGILTYVSPNTYFQATYGQKLRQFLAGKTRLRRVIDLPAFQMISLTIVTIEQQQPSPESWFWVLLWPDSQKLGDFTNKVQQYSFKMPQAALNPSGWQFMRPQALGLLEKLRKAGTPLGDYVQGRFYSGVIAGDEAFVVDRATRDRLIAEHPSSAEVLKPFVQGRDVKRWIVDSQDSWLLFIPWHFPLHEDVSIKGASIEAEKQFKKRYPAVYQYLLKFKHRLETDNAAERGRRYEWYALARCAASYWQAFEQPKIIYPNIARHCSFAFDQGQVYPAHTVSIIPAASPYLVGVLNSQLANFFMSQTAPALKGSLRFQSTYLSQIPIPPASPAEQSVITTLVEYVLYLANLHKNLPHSGPELMAKAPDHLMQTYFEQLINALVMELYLPEDLHSGDKYFFKHLPPNSLPPLQTLGPDPLPALRAIFEPLHDRDHPIRVNLYFLYTIEILSSLKRETQAAKASHP